MTNLPNNMIQDEELDKIITKVRFYPDKKFNPVGKFPHSIEAYHDEILTEAKQSLITWRNKAVVAELESINFHGQGSDKQTLAKIYTHVILTIKQLQDLGGQDE